MKKSYGLAQQEAALIVLLGLMYCQLASAQVQVTAAYGSPLPANNGVIELDLGQVNATDTTAASREFVIRNSSSAPITIEKIATSCGCTTTSVDHVLSI